MRPLSQAGLLDILAWVVIVLVAVPVGGAVWLGVVQGESPCILCWAQRTSMTLIALTALFVIRYGPRHRYLGLAVLLGTWGAYMAVRHAALHLARDVGQGFAAPAFGIHTYTWSWVVHVVALLVIGLLMLLRDDRPETAPPVPGAAGRFAMPFFLVVVGANAVQAFATTGPPPYMGQADPVRFSPDPRRWVWSLEELAGAVSLRGSSTIPAPTVAGLDTDPANGPLADLPALPVVAWERLGEGLVAGPLADLARDPATGRFLAVADRTVTVLDSTRSRVLHRVALDPTFAIDLSPLGGATFVGDTLAVLATNKSWVMLRPDGATDEDLMWRRFLATTGGVTELGRSRFQTVRARQLYVLSFAYDREADELVTVGVPSPRHRRLVVSRFARSDLRLSSEFEPRPAAGLRLRAPERSAAEYVVSGAVVQDGVLWAVSASYATLLAVDLRTRTIVGAWGVTGLDRPVGVAARGSELLVAQEDGRVAVITRPALH